MPYVTREQRAQLDPTLNALPALTAGELNYAITKLCLRNLGSTPTYDDYNRVMGVLSGASQEFYRMAVAKYEDDKIVQNGNVRP